MSIRRPQLGAGVCYLCEQGGGGALEAYVQMFLLQKSFPARYFD